MMFRRGLVSFLLLGAILPLFAMSPSTSEANAQALTTITSYITTSTTVTSTALVAIHTIKTWTYLFTTSYLTTSPPRTLFSGTVKARGATLGHCEVTSKTFTATKGQVIHINLTSNIEISLFKMSEEDYAKWYREGASCWPSDISDFFGAFSVTSLTEDLEVRSDGKYRFVFMNLTPNDARIQFNAEIIDVKYEVLSGTATRTMTATYYTLEAKTLTMMTTGTLIRTQQAGFSLGENGLLILALVLVAAVSVAVATVLRRRGRQKAIATAEKGVSVEG